jgi:general secretion pathway protein N
MRYRNSLATRQPVWVWTAAGALCGLFLACLLFPPARWLAAVIELASQGRVQLEDARGTVWHGSARLRLTGGTDSADLASLPSRLNWNLQPGWGILDARIDSACCVPQSLQLILKPLWRGMELTLKDGRVSLPASLLAGLGAPWNTLQATGQLELSSQELVVEWLPGSIRIAGQAELKALNLSSQLSTLRPLGTYQLTLRGGAVPGIELITLEGSLLLEGKGQWSGSRLLFNGTASAKPERAEALANLLNLIGRRKGDLSIISMV